MSKNDVFKWTEEAYQFLEQQLKSGASRTMIAAAFSERYGRILTKGSISGAVDRRWHDGPAVVREKKPLMNSVAQNRTVKLTKKKTTAVAVAKPRTMATEHWVATCKWIDGDPMAGEYTVCGQPAAIKPNGDAKPYCPHHCSIAYLKPQDRTQKAEQPATMAAQ